MSKSLRNEADRIIAYIKKGEIEKSLEIAEEELRVNPDSFTGQILMAVHSFFTNEHEEAAYWLAETLQREPENETVLEFAIFLYQSINFNRETINELIEKGLRLYPENDQFHAYHGQMIRAHNLDEALLSYKEAIRLSPYNDNYLGSYAGLLYQKGRFEEAEKFEQIALRENPENIGNLVNFAWFAYQMKKYNKATYLIEEAMRVDPNNEWIRQYYKKICPTKNPFVQTKIRINGFIITAIRKPAYWVLKLLQDKIPGWGAALIVFLAEIAGLYFLLGKGLYVLFGLYLLMVITSSRISKSILKAHGFYNDDQKELEKKTEKTQKVALKEMKGGLSTPIEQTQNEQPKLSMHELEAQLAQIWETDQLDVLKDNAKVFEDTESTVVAEVVDEKPSEVPVQEGHSKTPLGQSIEWPKEYNRWPAILISLLIAISIMVRFVPVMVERANRPEPISQELKESILETQEKMQEELLLEVEGETDPQEETQEESESLTGAEQAKWLANQFIESINENTLEQRIVELAAENYATVAMAHLDDPFMQQLGNAKLDKIIAPYNGLAIFYVSIVNEEAHADAVLEIAGGRILHVYVEEWLETAEEIEKYDQLKELLGEEGGH